MNKCGILIFFLLGACTHAAKDFSTSLERRQCHRARDFIPEAQSLNQLTDSASFLAKNAAAFSYVGLNYGAEAMLDASAIVGGDCGVVFSIPSCRGDVSLVSSQHGYKLRMFTLA
ncbi:MAG: hypothetical protein K2Q26_01455 [Bdellovibrionales bacterium]|nr:hypothetical protein [Bdellovibrionales bacterium]